MYRKMRNIYLRVIKYINVYCIIFNMIINIINIFGILIIIYIYIYTNTDNYRQIRKKNQTNTPSI